MAIDPTQSKNFTHNSTVAKGEPTWGSVDKAKLPRIAFARPGEPDKKSTWGFPHHWVKNAGDPDKDGIYETGTLYLHRGGLGAAWAAAMGGRSGKKAEPAVIAHLRKHFAAMGVKKATFEGVEYDVTEFDTSLLQAGLLTPADLQVNPGAMAIRLLGGE